VWYAILYGMQNCKKMIRIWSASFLVSKIKF
jgi:hypothetical protein